MGVGRAKCEGNFGYYPQSDKAQVGFHDACLKVGKDQYEACTALLRKVLPLFNSILAWTNVPYRFWGDVTRGARMSAFKIFFLNAQNFAFAIPHYGSDVLA